MFHQPAHAADPTAEGQPPAGTVGPTWPPVAIVVSRYNESITERLYEGAVRAWLSAGGDERALARIDAPGAFELAAVCGEACRSGRFAGVVALGCVIRGETDHDRYINESVSLTLAGLAAHTGIACAFGLVTTSTAEQAVARSGGPDGLGTGNKGEEAMRALILTIGAQQAIRGAGAALPGFRIPSGAQDKAASARA